MTASHQTCLSHILASAEQQQFRYSSYGNKTFAAAAVDYAIYFMNKLSSSSLRKRKLRGTLGLDISILINDHILLIDQYCLREQIPKMADKFKSKWLRTVCELRNHGLSKRFDETKHHVFTLKVSILRSELEFLTSTRLFNSHLK